MLCAAASPVKHEREGAKEQGETQAGQPDLQQLGFPVTFGRDADAVPAGEVDLREQEGHGHRQQGDGGQDARSAR